jgi:hypothetical protein
VSHHAYLSFRASRRTFLKTGVAGAAALLIVRSLNAETLTDAPRRPALTPAARDIFAAIVPVLLAGAFPIGPELASARAETIAAIEDAIAGLPPASRSELAELLSLLDFAPTRALVAGVWSPWSEASESSIAAFLARWRDSRFALLRSAYGALHQIVFAAWYAQPRAWPPTGYAGPPSIPSE